MHNLTKIALGFAVAGSLGLGGVARAEKDVTFSGDVMPVIQEKCAECHKPDGDGTKASGLDMSTYDALMKGTKFGAVIVPGEPDRSSLLILIDGRAKIRMPHDRKRLDAKEIRLFRRWIRQGAKNN